MNLYKFEILFQHAEFTAINTEVFFVRAYMYPVFYNLFTTKEYTNNSKGNLLRSLKLMFK